MAQDETPEPSASASSSSAAAAAAPAPRLNAAAPEFTPRSGPQHHGGNTHRRGPHHHQHHHHHQHYQPRNQHQQHHQYQGGEDEGSAAASGEEKEGPAGAGAGQGQPRLSDGDARKVVKQVEFYFSDINLATTEHLMKFIANDPDGYVPITVVASFRKIREIVSDRSMLVAALRTSSELVVSEDGKKVRRVRPFNTEEVQSRIVVAENLPDQKYQTLMKIFSDVGSVKSIRTCYPQDGAAPAASKSRIEMLFANKLHAFVEYGAVEDAEKAVAFSSEGKWRDGGIRVRSLLAILKHGLGQGKKGGDEYAVDEDGPDTTGHPHDYGTDDTTHNSEAHLDYQAEDGFYDKGGMRQGRGRGRGGRGRGRGQYYGNNRDAHHPIGTPPSEHPAVPKPPRAPRMPDGTKGFTMGRGKRLNPTPDITDAAPTTEAA